MTSIPAQSTRYLAEHLHTLVDSAEVLRLIYDITNCTVAWEGQPTLPGDPQTSRGLELFPCFTMQFQRQPLEVKGNIYPNLPGDGGGLSHLVRLELAGQTFSFHLTTPQTYLLSPFHVRFLSILFGRLILHHLVFSLDDQRVHPPFTPYSLEEQVVAGYLQSLRWAPCATIKLDAQDNPYIGSMLEALKQYLLHADGRTTFLALQAERLVGLLHLSRGTHRQLASVRAWNAALPLASISSRGRVTFWVPLKGRHTPQIPLVVLEYRHGHLRIPLFQDIFWLELERQLTEACPHCSRPNALPRLKRLLTMMRRGGHGAILILGLTPEQLASPETPLENQVPLESPAPLMDHWLPHLAGLAKSDGALIFNDHLEAVALRARLKATSVRLPPERDDLGSGMRHQVTREFTTFAPNLLGLAISQDGYLSLYREGKLVSRLF